MTTTAEQMQMQMSKARSAGETPVRWMISKTEFVRIMGEMDGENFTGSTEHPKTIFGLPYEVGHTRHGLGADLICENA